MKVKLSLYAAVIKGRDPYLTGEPHKEVTAFWRRRTRKWQEKQIRVEEAINNLKDGQKRDIKRARKVLEREAPEVGA